MVILHPHRETGDSAIPPFRSLFRRNKQGDILRLVLNTLLLPPLTQLRTLFSWWPVLVSAFSAFVQFGEREPSCSFLKEEEYTKTLVLHLRLGFARTVSTEGLFVFLCSTRPPRDAEVFLVFGVAGLFRFVLLFFVCSPVYLHVQPARDFLFFCAL